jgi:hypothetical protein
MVGSALLSRVPDRSVGKFVTGFLLFRLGPVLSPFVLVLAYASVALAWLGLVVLRRLGVVH